MHVCLAQNQTCYLQQPVRHRLWVTNSSTCEPCPFVQSLRLSKRWLPHMQSRSGKSCRSELSWGCDETGVWQCTVKGEAFNTHTVEVTCFSNNTSMYERLWTHFWDDFLFCHLPALWHWANYRIFLILNFLTCQWASWYLAWRIVRRTEWIAYQGA